MMSIELMIWLIGWLFCYGMEVEELSTVLDRPVSFRSALYLLILWPFYLGKRVSVLMRD